MFTNRDLESCGRDHARKMSLDRGNRGTLFESGRGALGWVLAAGCRGFSSLPSVLVAVVVLVLLLVIL